jgi:hypothetical protein
MTYGYIDTDKVRELASQGLNANKIGAMLGHSKTAIYLHCLSKKIPLVNGSIKLVNVDGVKMPIGEACELKGFTREAMYQYRVNRGLDIQEGFDAYVLYMQTKKPTATINSKNINLLFRHKLQPIQTIKSILGLGEGFLMFMRNNNYEQQAFDNYLYTRGIK